MEKKNSVELKREESLKSNHVHFPEDADKFGHDSDIGVYKVNDNLINIHLGFLQVRHRYEINFSFECPSSISDSLVCNPEPTNLNVRIVDLKIDNSEEKSLEKYKITVELFAYKEKLLKEYISLQSSTNPQQTLQLVFHARVLGKGKGTPSLKNGIKRIGIEMEDESEASDWQGFD